MLCTLRNKIDEKISKLLKKIFASMIAYVSSNLTKEKDEILKRIAFMA